MTLLAAFALVFGVLIAFDLHKLQQEENNRQELRQLTQALAESIKGNTAIQACATIGSFAYFINWSRHASGLQDVKDVILRLEEPSGNEVCASSALQGEQVFGGPENARTLTIADQEYLVQFHSAPPWQMIFAVPMASDVAYLYWLSDDLLDYMLIAFPLVLLPLWFAVRSGLSPLRTLAKRVAMRSPADVSPLGLDLRQAELKPLELAFDQLLANARYSIARERTFVLDAAHELRTPLAVITAQAHALVNAEGDQQIGAQEALERSVDRASHLIHQLLTLAHLEDGLPDDKQFVDLIEHTRQVLIDHTPMADKHDIQLSLDYSEPVEIQLSLTSYHSVLNNLLRNALTYCPSGSRVEVRVQRVGERVQLHVLDNGPGILEDDKPQLFERFFRGQDLQISGTGLGLAIVREAARHLGGTVSLCEGTDGRGVGFLVEFGTAY